MRNVDLQVVMSCFALTVALSAIPFPARAWPDDVFAQFLAQGGWSRTADDNVQGENLSSALIEKIVTDFHAKKQDRDRRTALGLLALAMGVAEWGVADPEGLPPDPARNAWKSDTGARSGKHLMSYAVGGVGISHADANGLRDFLRHVQSSKVVPPEHNAALARLLERPVYVKPGPYDQIRAAGVCAAQKLDADLMGETFAHFEVPPGAAYCAKYANGFLTPNDWQVFRTWMRAALRTEEGQRWLIGRWMAEYWFPTLNKVPAGPGQIEEALINVRIRNSSPVLADKAFLRHAAEPEARLRRELDVYGEAKPDALRRRCGIMLRPVVLYRHFAGEPPIDVSCPPRS